MWALKLDCLTPHPDLTPQAAALGRFLGRSPSRAPHLARAWQQCLPQGAAARRKGDGTPRRVKKQVNVSHEREFCSCKKNTSKKKTQSFRSFFSRYFSKHIQVPTYCSKYVTESGRLNTIPRLSLFTPKNSRRKRC